MHIPLAELLGMDGSTVLVGQWVTAMRAAWAAHRAAASEGGGGIGAWLDGDAARAVACDAAMAPVVTGEVNPAALEDMVRLCVQLDRLRHGAPDGDDGDDDGDDAGDPVPADATWAREAIEQAVIGAAIDLLSGPGGLASFLRRRQLGARLAGPSLPLDVGYAETVPAGIRNAVILRDQRCRWAGGCNQPAAACEVHHVKHKANGGKTSTKECVLLVFLSPPGHDPPPGLDPGPQPRRHHHGLEQGPHQGTAQPRTARPPGVKTRHGQAPAPDDASPETKRARRHPVLSGACEVAGKSHPGAGRSGMGPGDTAEAGGTSRPT